MLRQHLAGSGTAADGRLFRGARGGVLSESVYGRAWHAARQAALGPGLAATALARRPYELRHAALSLWLNATGAPVEIAARAGTSTRVPHDVYVHCISGQDDTVSQRIEDALDPGAGVPGSSRCGKASGYAHRRHHPRPCPLHMAFRRRLGPTIGIGHESALPVECAILARCPAGAWAGHPEPGRYLISACEARSTIAFRSSRQAVR